MQATVLGRADPPKFKGGIELWKWAEFDNPRLNEFVLRDMVDGVVKERVYVDQRCMNLYQFALTAFLTHPDLNGILVRGMPLVGKSAALKVCARLFQNDLDQIRDDPAEKAQRPWAHVYYVRASTYLFDRATKPELSIDDSALERPYLLILDEFEEKFRFALDAEMTIPGTYVLLCSNADLQWPFSDSPQSGVTDCHFPASASWDDFYRFRESRLTGKAVVGDSIPAPPAELSEEQWYTFLPGMPPTATSGGRGRGRGRGRRVADDDLRSRIVKLAEPLPVSRPPARAAAPPAPAPAPAPATAAPMSTSDLFLYSNGVFGVSTMVDRGNVFRSPVADRLREQMGDFCRQNPPSASHLLALMEKGQIGTWKSFELCDQRFWDEVRQPGYPVERRIGCPFFAQLYMQVLASSSAITTRASGSGKARGARARLAPTEGGGRNPAKQSGTKRAAAAKDEPSRHTRSRKSDDEGDDGAKMVLEGDDEDKFPRTSTRAARK